MLLSKSSPCKSISVEILGDSKNQIIDEDDIKQIILNNNSNIIGTPINRINLSDLEKTIEEHPAVKNAEVFAEINGVLGIKLEQKTPIVRVMPNYGEDFYISNDGSLMPTSNMGSARVMVASGFVNFKYKKNKISIADTSVTKRIKDIYVLSKKIAKDNFLTSQTEQIYIKRKGEYELIPAVGNHIVLLGKINDLDNKLKYLKHFYLNVLKKEGWRKYKYINLKFANQIVCTINDKN